MTLTFARWTTLASIALVLGGCGEERDATTEEPVEVTPGSYHVTLNGQTAALPFARSNSPGSVDETICVRSGEERSFPGKVASLLRMQPECSHRAGDRKGNAISGVYSCPTDQGRMPGGSFDTAYSGTISTDRVDIQGQTVMNLPELPGMSEQERAQLEQAAVMMQQVTIVIAAERTGDCG